MQQPSRVISAAFALCAFSVAVLSGVAAGNPGEIVLGRALIALVACQLVGWVIGMASEHIVREHVSVHRETYPVPAFQESGTFGTSEHSSTNAPQSGG